MKSVGDGPGNEKLKTVRVKATTDDGDADDESLTDAPTSEDATVDNNDQPDSDRTSSEKTASETAKTDKDEKAEKLESETAKTDKDEKAEKAESETDNTDKTDKDEKAEKAESEPGKTDTAEKAEKAEKAESDKSETEKVDSEPATEDGGRSRPRRWWKWALAGLVLVAVPIIVVAVALRDIGQGRSSRGVDVAGVAVGNTGQAGVDAAVSELAADFADSEITVETEQGPFVATAADLGIAIDDDATVAAVMEVGRTGSSLAQVAGWFGSFTGDKSVPLVVDVPTQDRVDAWVAENAIDIESVEPVIRRSRDGFDFEPGVVGRRLETAPIVESIPTRLSRASLPVLAGTFEVLPPDLADEAPNAIADLINRNTEDGLEIRVAAETRTVAATDLRRWLSIDTGTQEVDIDESAVTRFLSTEFADLAQEGEPATFRVVDREPKLVVPSYRGHVCCREGSTQEILDSVLEGDGEVELRLDLNPSTRTAEWAESLKIVEEVGGFTTRHPCCAGRVRNIQRMADLVKGAIIEPGELFSLNEYVGKRTRENGFTGGGVIYDGVFTEDVGGGVSQFVTTLFNAAFFAGLDFGEYQSHSLYISRYPYGREATISWPAPDFQIKNNTEYGVLIWPSYTGSSITVRLYSTEYAPGEQVAQYKARGRCTNVETIRERTYPDGSTERDSVVATYRPAQGVRC